MMRVQGRRGATAVPRAAVAVAAAAARPSGARRAARAARVVARAEEDEAGAAAVAEPEAFEAEEEAEETFAAWQEAGQAQAEAWASLSAPERAAQIAEGYSALDDEARQAFEARQALAAADADAEAAKAPGGSQGGDGEAVPKLWIKLRCYSAPPLEEAADAIMDVVRSTGCLGPNGPAYLPTKRRIFCVLRSPHVNKDSREHFEIRTHQRVIEIRGVTSQTIDSLMSLDLPAGVDVEVKL